MKIVEVNNIISKKEFIKVNIVVNKNTQHYVRPLDSEIDDIFNPSKNKNYQYGKAIRWILKDENGNLIGRIAAFINSKYINKGTNFATGAIGFFDCINNQTAANLLFDTAKKWLQLEGMEAMDGPINFGDRDKYWGLLVEGFDKPPIYGMPFNAAYYENLFQVYGFKNYYNQYWFQMSVDDDLPPKFQERYAKFNAKPDYSAKHLNIKELDKYADNFTTIYNTAWAQHGEAKTITKEEALKLFKAMKPIMDERVIWFAYYKEEPIAMFINIPDVNQYIKDFNGKLGFIEKLKLLWMKSTMKRKKLLGLVFGVVPKYQALGIDSYLIQACGYNMQHKGWYDNYEMGWAGDWNPRMYNVYKSLGGTQSRRMVTFRYIFDETKNTFERHPQMEYNIRPEVIV
jgi:hypothetical protein